MYLLFVFSFLIANGSNLAATAPIHTRNHALPTSPLFNTPLAPPPAAFGAIFHRVIALSRRQTLHPMDLLRGSTHDDTLSTSSDNSLSTITATTLGEAPEPLASTLSPAFPSGTAVLLTTTVFVPAESTVSSVAVPFTKTVTMTVPVTTLTLEPSTVTVTALPSGPATSDNTNRLSVQSITVLETVPFTTTDLPAVTVTGLQTLTSVVVIPVEETAAADLHLRLDTAVRIRPSSE
jgi:hypothetical protein